MKLFVIKDAPCARKSRGNAAIEADDGDLIVEDLGERITVGGIGRAVCFGEVVFIASFVGFALCVDVVISGDGGEGVRFKEGVEFKASVLEFGVECGGGKVA